MSARTYRRRVLHGVGDMCEIWEQAQRNWANHTLSPAPVCQAFSPIVPVAAEYQWKATPLPSVD